MARALDARQQKVFKLRNVDILNYVIKGCLRSKKDQRTMAECFQSEEIALIEISLRREEMKSNGKELFPFQPLLRERNLLSRSRSISKWTASSLAARAQRLQLSSRLVSPVFFKNTRKRDFKNIYINVNKPE